VEDGVRYVSTTRRERAVIADEYGSTPLIRQPPSHPPRSCVQSSTESGRIARRIADLGGTTT